ncbi:hypothetical protein PINS_up005799 [Pythium insidiosum]|nr:hypothetical protein PINS_up005799 [Pythium insidiosum]
MSSTAPPSFRGRVLDAKRSAYAPRTQLELSLRAGIGSVLCKPQWWRKWRAPPPKKRAAPDGACVPSVADKWLDEIARNVLQNRFYWTTKHSSHWFRYAHEPFRRRALQGLIGFPFESSPTPERAAALRRFQSEPRAEIAYALWWCPQQWPKDAFEPSSTPFMTWGRPRTEADEAPALADFEREIQTCNFFGSARFLEDFEWLDSTAVIAWYFGVLALSRRVKQQANGEWPEDAELRLADEDTRQRALDLIMMTHNGDVTEETFTTMYPDADARPEAVALIWSHVERAAWLVTRIRDCVRDTLDELIEDDDLMNPESAKGSFISPGPAIETWFSDSIIPEDVKARFVSQVAVLEDVPDNEKDWHPGSNKQVLDLVHPSLYCCALRETKRIPEPQGDENEARDDDMSVIDKMHRIMFSATEIVAREATSGATYQWIPSDFLVDANGHVEILSYINNLHPVRHGEMYSSIAAIFAQFVPLFDRVLSWLACPSAFPPLLYMNLRERGSLSDYYHIVPNFPQVPDRLALQFESPTPYTLKGTTVQVITKIAEIVLTPESPTYPGGAWHVEGTDTESIVATGIYYFGCENISESKLSFRVIVRAPDYAQSDDLGVATIFGLENDRALVQSLGAVTAVEDRCLVFPNTFQHKVEPFELADRSKPGVRKILAFFIVDPSKKIASTSVIPPQQRDWIEQGRREMLVDLSKLPEVVAESSLREMLGQGMSLETARDHRKRLMEERGPFSFDDHEDLIFSLCEH